MVGFLKARLARGDDGPESAYRARLVTILQKHHIAGSEAALTKVFVNPRLLAPQDALDQDAVLDDSTAVLHYLWPDMAARVATVPPPSITLTQLMAHARRILISGEPGAGKSTLLAYYAIQAAAGSLEGKSGLQAGLLPVHLHLSQLEKQAAAPGQAGIDSANPLEILQEALTQLGLTTRGFKEVLVSAADAGRLFLFIDGWDELPGVGLGHSGRWLEELLLAYPETRVLMSAPIRGYGPLHRLDFLVAGLIPWRRGQAMAVGQNWAAARDEGRSPSMMSYWRPGQTPLVTWLRLNQLARADSAGQPPIRLSASEMLRQEVDHALMSQMLESDATSMLPVLRRLIQHLAHQMIADRTWALAEEDVTILAETLPGTMPGDELRPGTTEVLRILSGSGLFADAANSVRFLSPVIRDYLAAMYLVGHVGWADVTPRVSESHWAGAIRFYMAFIGSRGRLAELPELDQHERQLYQAVSWVTEMKGEDPSRRRVLISLGKRCLDTKAPPIARQRAAVALAATGDPGVAVLMHQVMRQPDPAMRQVALAVLAQVAPRDVVEAAPRMMSDSDRRVRAASVHALAWIGDPAADEALLEALYSKDTSISGAAAEALALSGTDPNYQALRDAAQSRQFSARQAARTGLRLIDEPWAAELLVRSLSIDGLASASGSGSTPFVDRSDQDAARWRRLRAGDQPWLVAWAVERGQIVPVGQAAVPLLLEALLDGEAAIRVRAAATLGQLAILDGTGALREALHDEAPEVRQAAFIALSKIGRAWDMDA